MCQVLEILPFAQETAHRAGDILMDYYGKSHQIEYKSPGDVVTEADKASERFVTQQIQEAYPDHAILGEEFGLSSANSSFCWAIDPLDGTANYAKHFPIFAVSIALLQNGEPILGLVYEPVTNRTFSAVTGHGATLNGTPISVNSNGEISPDGLFGFSSRNMKAQLPFMQHISKGRNVGSAALHLCSVAAGYMDGSLDLGTKLWDVAAGAVILQEAGGKVTHPSGNTLFALQPNDSAYAGGVVAFLATNGKIHQQCVSLIGGSS